MKLTRIQWISLFTLMGIQVFIIKSGFLDSILPSKTHEPIAEISDLSKDVVIKKAGQVTWSKVDEVQKCIQGDRLKTLEQGHLVLKWGQSQVFAPEGESVVEISSTDTVTMVRGSMWVATQGERGLKVARAGLLMNVLPSTLANFGSDQSFQIDEGSVEINGQTYAKGAYRFKDQNVITQTHFILRRPVAIERVYSWEMPLKINFMQLNVSGEVTPIASDKNTSNWSLEFRDFQQNRFLFMGSGKTVNYEVQLVPRTYLVRLKTETEHSPWSLVELVRLPLPSVLKPQLREVHGKFLESRKLFVLWRGDDQIPLYEASLACEELGYHDVQAVGYPQTYFTLPEPSNKPTKCLGSIRASHPQAGWGPPVPFTFTLLP